MSAEFLPLYRLCGTSISSMAHSWKGRLYSVNRFQSAYARRTMILPFSSSRSSTSFSSNCLYCASLTPRAEATFVLQHADPDYTTNTPLADLLLDAVVLAGKHNG